MSSAFSAILNTPVETCRTGNQGEGEGYVFKGQDEERLLRLSEKQPEIFHGFRFSDIMRRHPYVHRAPGTGLG